jgi:hypothetical protein
MRDYHYASHMKLIVIVLGLTASATRLEPVVTGLSYADGTEADFPL